MSNGTNNTWDLLAPWDIFRQMRDAYLENAATLMANMVSTEDYAKASGALLSMYLEAMAPAQAWADQVMPHVLAYFGVPSRQELISVAARMTNIEMQLDNIAAAVNQIRQQLLWSEQSERRTV